MKATVMDRIEDQQAGAKRRFMRCVGARSASTQGWQPPGLGNLGRHFFGGYTPSGKFIVVEMWSPIFACRAKVLALLVASGWRVALLPTRFSTLAIGRRQPIVLVPPGSDVDPKMILAALEAANFEGCSNDDP